MSRSETNRSLFHDLWGNRPFRAFAINFENGDRVVVEHPENVAFDFRKNGQDDFVLRNDKLRYFATFSAITSLAILDEAEVAA